MRGLFRSLPQSLASTALSLSLYCFRAAAAESFTSLAMAVTGVSFYSASLSPVIRRDFTPSVGKFSKSNPISFRRLAVSTEQTQTPTTTATPTTTTTPTPTPTRRLSEKSEELGEAGVAASDDEVEQNGRVLKEYFERSKELISRSDGGPPRWFTPLECGPPLKNSPLLLFLPGQYISLSHSFVLSIFAFMTEWDWYYPLLFLFMSHLMKWTTHRKKKKKN